VLDLFLHTGQGRLPLPRLHPGIFKLVRRWRRTPPPRGQWPACGTRCVGLYPNNGNPVDGFELVTPPIWRTRSSPKSAGCPRRLSLVARKVGEFACALLAVSTIRALVQDRNRSLTESVILERMTSADPAPSQRRVV